MAPKLRRGGPDRAPRKRTSKLRVPRRSTFTFIFRAIASIDGIGKGLDEDYDLGGFAQPFVERLIEKLKYPPAAPKSLRPSPRDSPHPRRGVAATRLRGLYPRRGVAATRLDESSLRRYGGDNSKKALAIFGKATGLNAEDVNTALTQPRKIEYLENTMRAIEQGQLKIRVRSLENEMALTRLGTQSKATTNLLLASLALNVAAAAKLSRIPTIGLFAAAAAVGASGLSALLSLAAFDKKAAKYKSKDFNT